ncbi:MAG: peptidyl-prolyl cis-trans isomerase [Solirubrobacteraceae bacterium]
MKTKRTILALGAFFMVIAVVISGCGSGVPGDSVANVAGNPISTQAFNHWMYVAADQQASQSPGQPVIVPNDPPNFTKCVAQVRAQIPTLKSTPDSKIKTDCKTLFTSLGGQVMDFLIKSYWYQADAHKLGIKLTNTQVQTALNTIKKSEFKDSTAQFDAYLKSSGQTLADVLYRIRVSSIFTKLAKRHPTTVTPAAIQNYYNAHKSQYGTPESRNIRIVLTKTAAQASAAKAALAHGKSWTVVAKKYSSDPTTKNKGGLLTNVTQGQQDTTLTTAAFSAPENKVLGPIKGQFGYYVIDVVKITPGTQKSLAQSTALIKQTLTTNLQTAAETAVDNMAKKDWKSKTTCRSVYAMADCSDYKAPKATATAAATGAATGTTPAPAATTTAP